MAAYLALFGGQRHSRAVLADLIWGEEEGASTRQSLRTALTSLRQIPGSNDAEALIMSDHESVWLNEDAVSTDVSRFESGIRRAAHCDPRERADILAEAVSEVRGPLLSGFEDSWIYPQWLRLEEAYAQAVIQLVSTWCDENRHAEAITVGKAAVAILGGREDVQVELIRAYGQSGNASLALAQFESLERMLDDKWGEPPSEAAYQALEELPKVAPRVVMKGVPARLPGRRGQFFGREEEIRQLDVLFEDPRGPRLVTLTGPGGSGKTVLSEEYLRRAAKTLGGRVWSVPLAALEDPSAIWTAICQRLDMAPGNDAFGALCKALDPESGLLHLDNFEQLGPAGANEIGRLLEETVHLRLLVTSRHLLRVMGEQAFPVRPLPTPSVSARFSELADSTSVQLFVNRAKLARPDFELTTSNAEVIAEICRRLDGLPLALELAASKVSVLSPAELLGEIGRSYTSLAARETDRSDRHKSLEAALVWSLKSLPEGAVAAFESMCIFRGEFPKEAAVSVIGSETSDESLLLLSESSLIESSLDEAGAVWFRILEPIRQYGLEALRAKGQEESAARAMISHYRRVVDDQCENLAKFDELSRQAANLWIAAEAAIRIGSDRQQLADYVVKLRTFARTRGFVLVWRELLARVRAEVAGKIDTGLEGLLTLEHARSCGNLLPVDEVLAMYTVAESQLAQANDLENLARCHQGIAANYKARGEYAMADPYYLKAVSHYEATGNQFNIANCYRDWAMNACSIKDYAEATRRLTKALAAARVVGDPETLAWTLTDMATELAIQGRVEESEEHFTEAFEICASLKNKRLESIILWQHGESQYRTGRYAESLVSHQKCIRSALEGGYAEGTKWYLLTMGCAFQAVGDDPAAARCWGKMGAMREAEGRKYSGDELELLDPAQDAARKVLGDDGFDRERARGASMPFDSLMDQLTAERVG